MIAFHDPDEAHHEEAMIKSLFGDGADTVIVGAALTIPIERPIFHMVLKGIGARSLRGGGIKGFLVDALEPLGLARGDGWNDLFWVVHPGGPAVLESYRSALGLQAEKLAVSRHVLSEYGNMIGATIIFVLDELRRRHGGDEDLEWGVMLGLGPGLIVETMVLHATGNQEGETSTSP
ncbi:hypothetical protein C2845_PMPSC048691 [Panicum miliaceum]|uniref:chalcone synthase n=1 Tax=Panicum miliaceum TaxID=4540 RepID=A0A3L6PD73_PANMI|nr:hypothetical protein C2845_PMPSC048691 [Panicum miliaceum]